MKEDEIIAPRRNARQDRSRERVSAILTAGVKLLEDEGAEALTTKRIAQVAEMSVGSLYRYFPNKESVVAAIFEAKIDAEIQKGRSGEGEPVPFHEMPFEDAIRWVVQMVIDRHRRWFELAPEFYREHYGSFSVGERLGRPEELMRSYLERHRDQLVVENLDNAAYLVARGLLSAAVRAAVREKPEYLESPEFAEELSEAVFHYLCGPAER